MASGVALNVNDVLDGVLTFVPGFLIPPKVKTSASEASRPLGPKGKGDPVDRAAEPKKVTGGTENNDPWLRGREMGRLAAESVGGALDGAVGGEKVKVGLEGGSSGSPLRRLVALKRKAPWPSGAGSAAWLSLRRVRFTMVSAGFQRMLRG